MYNCRFFFTGIIFLINLYFISFNAQANILKEVQSRGFLNCGINTGLVGFSEMNANGQWNGFDVDFCKAISATIFDDVDKVKYIPLNATDRFITLQSKQIDILSRNTGWTLTRETTLGLAFRPITYFDGQGFMMRKKPNISSSLQLSGAAICVQAGTTTEITLSDYFRTNKMKYHPIVFERVEEINAAYLSNRCDVYTGDKSALYTLRLSTSDPSEHIILPETISKEPLGPVIIQGDSVWNNVVSWTHYALVNAEELGITKENVENMRNSNSPDIKRFLGTDGNKIGSSLGLTNDWAYRIIRHMGNYREIFDRNLGKNSILKIPHGYNALWSNGGIMYAPPIR
ncbi:amino acid ABC transporter substrate-binding protein [Candidatus Liberibacter americanus]|uniref:ABC-type amino acid transport system, periplasmic component n=1 Tax=Candidatus Liberibacter americanus str. Sao Paulo TaxID=1261131 RepID=U6B6A7_9HYPH|nr:amino acid ABC transporter substrate-binding protein [Candidatus Liberibacter americanus]AHA28309.1 ABC-type amino acid transport system, periplasmic component [Candidatus Liberibacter americanus str. Sao Paulo]EMS36600.1 cationic amino acid ABC transporter periplasmic binding protein [Candidatus Liberibacter americanus PW_SP]